MKMENKIKKAYSDIFELMRKHEDICSFDSINELERKSKCHLFGVELKEKYGLDIDPKNIKSLDYISLGEYVSVGWWGEKYKREISWSDDGTQPEDELLLRIYFSTGAYIFGKDYPTKLFGKMFRELQSYNPKYSDSHNGALYFAISDARHVFNGFNSILKKYHDLNKKDVKQRKIKEMKDELKKLEDQ